MSALLHGWSRGDLAVYQGGIPESVARLTEGDTYVVNSAGRVHSGVYLQIVDDDRIVHDILDEHFTRTRKGRSR